jgi:hypothetical protein
LVERFSLSHAHIYRIVGTVGYGGIADRLYRLYSCSYDAQVPSVRCQLLFRPFHCIMDHGWHKSVSTCGTQMPEVRCRANIYQIDAYSPQNGKKDDVGPCNDPVNYTDPSGLRGFSRQSSCVTVGYVVSYGGTSEVRANLVCPEVTLDDERRNPGLIERIGDGGGRPPPGPPKPQKSQPTRSVTDCLGQTAKTAGVGLALDLAGVGLALAPPAKAAVALGGLAVGAAAMTNSSIGADAVGFSAGLATYGFAAAGPEASRLSTAAVSSRGRAIASSIPGVGLALAVGALGYDSYNAYQSYNQCRRGQ